MDALEPLEIAFHICDEHERLDKLLVVGQRIDGSVLILQTGLTEKDVNGLYRDFRLWIGEALGEELTKPAT